MKDKQTGYQTYEVARMKDAFERGRLTRRDFMQGLLAVGLTVSGATAIIAGSNDVQAQTPKRGGRIRFAFNRGGPDETLDPALFTDNLDYVRGRAYYNNLLRFNDDLSLAPDLAEEWSSNADATEWMFKLRKGVEFHDGKPFDVEDVIYTLNRHIGKDSISKMTPFVNMVTEWKKVDQYTVKAILASPNVDLATILAVFQFKIIQNGAQGDYFLKPIGTGPFKCTEFSPGVRSMGVRNDNYYVSDHPYVDEIETMAITDTTARVNALISGDVDLIAPVDPNAIQQINDDPNVEMYTLEAGFHSAIVCQLENPPGNNRDFVLALKYLQRRDRIVKGVLKGEGAIGNDQPISKEYQGFCADLPQREFDPDKAKFHLQKSGITEATIDTAEIGAGITDTILLLQAEAQKIGLKIEVKRVPLDGFWGSVWMNRPITVTAWNMRPTVNMMLSIAYQSKAPWNETQFRNERFDQLLVASQAETDVAKRNQMYCDMQTLINEEGGTILPAFSNYIDAKANKVKGLQKIPICSLGGQEWPEYVWLDV